MWILPRVTTSLGGGMRTKLRSPFEVFGIINVTSDREMVSTSKHPLNGNEGIKVGFLKCRRIEKLFIIFNAHFQHHTLIFYKLSLVIAKPDASRHSFIHLNMSYLMKFNKIL